MLRLSRISFLGILCVLPASLSAKDHDLSFTPDDGKVEFRAIGQPSALRVIGKAPGFSGRVSVIGRSVSGVLSFKLADLDTGIELRNTHMKHKYLQIEKFPEAKLTFSAVQLPSEWETLSSSFTLPFSGVLSMHGVDHPVSGNAEIEKQDYGQLKVEAEFQFSISDFSIARPGFSGIALAQDVTVKVESVGKPVATARTPSQVRPAVRATPKLHPLVRTPR